MSVNNEDTSFNDAASLEIEEWMDSLGRNNIQNTLADLGLRIDGTIFIKADRLYRRLQGDYSEEDFAPTQEEIDVTTRQNKRDEALLTLLSRTNFSNTTKCEILTQNRMQFDIGNNDEPLLHSTTKTSDMEITQTHSNHINSHTVPLAIIATVVNTNISQCLVVTSSQFSTSTTTPVFTTIANTYRPFSDPITSSSSSLIRTSTYEQPSNHSWWFDKYGSAHIVNKNIAAILEEQERKLQEYEMQLRQKTTTSTNTPGLNTISHNRVTFNDTYDIRYTDPIAQSSTRENQQGAQTLLHGRNIQSPAVTQNNITRNLPTIS